MAEHQINEQSMSKASFSVPRDGNCIPAGRSMSPGNPLTTWTPLNLPLRLNDPYAALPSSTTNSNDNMEEEEADRDLEGSKHVLTGPKRDGVYSIGSTKLHAIQLVEKGEKDVEQELRDYLISSVPKEMLTDDYGQVLPIDQFQPHKLVQFQAKLWEDLPRSQAANASPSGSCSPGDILLGVVIESIARKLARAPHAFVIQHMRHKGCNNPMCCREHNLAYRQVVALEPLLNNGSIISASDLNLFNGEILVFRRNEDLLVNKGLDIDLILSNRSMVFCVGCIGWLWEQRRRVWAVMASVGVNRGVSPVLSAVSQRPLDDYKTMRNSSAVVEEVGGNVSVDEADEVSAWGEDAQAAAGEVKYSLSATPSDDKHSRGVDSESGQGLPLLTADLLPFTQAVPQLDGVGSRRARKRAVHHPEQQDYDQENIDPQTMEHFPPTSRHICNSEPTLAAITPTWTAVNVRNTTTRPQVTMAEEPTSDDNAASSDLDLHLEQDDIANIVPYQGTLDKPAVPVISPGYYTAERAQGPPEMVDYKETGVTFPDSPTTDTGFVGLPPPPRKQHPAVLPGGLSRLEILDRAEIAAYGFPTGLNKPQRETTPLKPDPIRAVFPPLTRTPSPPETGDNKFPVNKEPITVYCFCRKPDNGTKMVKCSREECVVGWYHYSCFSKAQKISVNKSNEWVCEACKLDMYHPTEFGAPATDFSSPFSTAQCIGRLSMPGPADPVADPYGLASMPDFTRPLYPAELISTPRTATPAADAYGFSKMSKFLSPNRASDQGKQDTLMNENLNTDLDDYGDETLVGTEDMVLDNENLPAVTHSQSEEDGTIIGNESSLAANEETLVENEDAIVNTEGGGVQSEGSLSHFLHASDRSHEDEDMMERA